jgi:hypothetical protein
MPRRKKLPPAEATVEAIWWRDPYEKSRTTGKPVTYAYCTIGLVWRETDRYVMVAREVTAQDEDYLSERDDQKIYKSLIYKRAVIGKVSPHDPIDDEDEDEERDEPGPGAA